MFFTVFSYVAGYLAVMFLAFSVSTLLFVRLRLTALSLATHAHVPRTVHRWPVCGMYYLADLAEEHPTTTRACLKYAIYVRETVTVTFGTALACGEALTRTAWLPTLLPPGRVSVPRPTVAVRAPAPDLHLDRDAVACGVLHAATHVPRAHVHITGVHPVRRCGPPCHLFARAFDAAVTHHETNNILLTLLCRAVGLVVSHVVWLWYFMSPVYYPVGHKMVRSASRRATCVRRLTGGHARLCGRFSRVGLFLCVRMGRPVWLLPLPLCHRQRVARQRRYVRARWACACCCGVMRDSRCAMPLSPAALADGMMAGRSRKSNFCKWVLDMFRQQGANVLPTRGAFKRDAHLQ